MKRAVALWVGGCALFLLLAAPALAAKCSPDSVQVGPLCVDKYEASVWEIPATNAVLLQKVQAAGYRSGSANFRGIINQTLIKDKRFGKAERGMYQLKK